MKGSKVQINFIHKRNHNAGNVQKSKGPLEMDLTISEREFEYISNRGHFIISELCRPFCLYFVSSIDVNLEPDMRILKGGLDFLNDKNIDKEYSPEITVDDFKFY